MNFNKSSKFFIYSILSFVIIFIAWSLDDHFNILKFTALVNALIVTSVIFHLLVIKRTFFDLRIYVLYGIFHQIIIGQFVTLYLDTSYYFGLSSDFSDETKLKANLLILVCVLIFLLTYLFINKKQKFTYLIKFDNKLNINRLLFFIILTGLVGKGVLYSQAFGWIHLHFTLLLPLTYLGNVSVILSAYFIFVASYKIENRIYRVIINMILSLNILWFLSSSNVAFIYPLFAVIFWFLNKNYKMIQVSKKFVMWLFIGFPFLIVINYIVKVMQYTNINSTSIMSIDRLFSQELKEQVVRRILTLDVFNVESYVFILNAIELYANTLNLYWGKTLLIMFPILKFIIPDLRGMGRTLAIDIMGPSAEFRNVAFSASPILEFLANFWYGGSFLFYLILAFMIKYLYNNFYLTNENDNFKFVIFSIIPPWIFIQERGDFMIGNLYFLYMSFIIWIIFKFSRKKEVYID